MKNTIASVLYATTFLAISGCSTIIGAMAPEPMSEEVAQKTLERNQTYLTDHSFAFNICRYTVTGNGDISCYNDAKIPRAEYEKTFGKNKGPAGSDFATSLALYSLPAIVDSSTFFSSFDNWGPGALILAGDTLKGDGPKATNRFVAFVPISKAKTKEEALAYVHDAFFKAYRSIFKKYGLKEVTAGKKDYYQRKLGDAMDYYKGILVSDGKYCDYDDPVKKKKGATRCLFSTTHHNWYLDGVQTVIPDWLLDAGQKAWVVAGHAELMTIDNYEGPLKQRDLAIDEAKALPNNFYLLVPQTFEGSPLKGFKKLPPFVVSNKNIYFYAVPED